MIGQIFTENISGFFNYEAVQLNNKYKEARQKNINIMSDPGAIADFEIGYN